MRLTIHPESYAPTIFWWDSFGRFVDTDTGGGSIQNTPGIAFQEETSNTVRRKDLSINRSKRTSLIHEEALPLKRLKIDPKRKIRLTSTLNMIES